MFYKNLLTLLLVLVLGSGVISARELVVTQNKDKYGYADENGEIVIKPQYTHAYPFENGMAKVAKGEKWGYINESGKAIVPIQYDNIEPFENGLARVQKGKKYGYITEDGAVYIKPEYDFIGSFNDDGWLWVGKGKTFKDAAKGLYHHDKLIIKPSKTITSLGFYVKTDSVDYTSGDPIAFSVSAPKNNEITQNFSRLSVSDAPYIWTSSTYVINCVYDLNGKQLLKIQGAAVGMPQNGLAITRSLSKKKDKSYYKFNYLSTDGKNKKLFKKDIQQQLDFDDLYQSCRHFENGYALCGTETEAYIINTKGETVSALYDRLTPVETKGFIAKKGNKYGFVTMQGKENVAPTYALILPSFQNSFVFPAKDNSTGKYGFIDFDGEQVVPFRFEDARAFTDGKGYVMENGKYGIVDSKGNYIVASKWQKIQPAIVPGMDYVWVVNPDLDKWQCVQISKDAVCFKDAFDAAAPFDEKGRAIVSNNDIYGAVATDGGVVLPQRFDNYDIAKAALSYIDNIGKKQMTETDAYKFNIYNSSARHKYRMHQLIDSQMWDY